MSNKKKKKQAEMPEDPLKESFDPWFIHKLSTDKEFAGYKWELKLDSQGRQKRDLVYRGNHYYFNYKGKELGLIRRKVAILTIISLILIFATSGFITASSVSNPVVSCCELFALIPTIYEIMGLWTLCTCQQPFEMRIPMLSVRRMKSCALGIMFLIGVAGVVHIYYMFSNLGNGMLIPDLIVTIGMAAGIVLQYLMRRVLLTFSLEKVEEDDEEEDETDTKGSSASETSDHSSSTAAESSVPNSGNKSENSESNNAASKNRGNPKKKKSKGRSEKNGQKISTAAVDQQSQDEDNTDVSSASVSEAAEKSIASCSAEVEQENSQTVNAAIKNTGNSKKRNNKTNQQKRTSSDDTDSEDSKPQNEDNTDMNKASASGSSENSTSPKEKSVMSDSENESSDFKSQNEVENT